jgi:hypothetical protein
LHLEINDSFVGLDSAESLTGLNAVADLFVPLSDVTLRKREKTGVLLTFSMVGDRLGISSLMWSGSELNILIVVPETRGL